MLRKGKDKAGLILFKKFKTIDQCTLTSLTGGQTTTYHSITALCTAHSGNKQGNKYFSNANHA